MFGAAAAGDLAASLELRIGEERFHAHVAKGELMLVRGNAPKPDAIIQASAETLVAVVYGGRRFAEAVRAGDLRVEGHKAIAKEFLTFFPMPATA